MAKTLPFMETQNQEMNPEMMSCPNCGEEDCASRPLGGEDWGAL